MPFAPHLAGHRLQGIQGLLPVLTLHGGTAVARWSATSPTSGAGVNAGLVALPPSCLPPLAEGAAACALVDFLRS